MFDYAARYADKEHVATAQVATTGLVSLAYLRRLSEKVCHSLVQEIFRDSVPCVHLPRCSNYIAAAVICGTLRPAACSGCSQGLEKLPCTQMTQQPRVCASNT